MNKKSRRLTKLVSKLNQMIDSVIFVDLNNQDVDNYIKGIDRLFQIIKFEMLYLELKKNGNCKD